MYIINSFCITTIFQALLNEFSKIFIGFRSYNPTIYLFV